VTVERQVQEALAAGVAGVVGSHDLLDRVRSSIEDDRRIRSQHTRRVLVLLCLAAAIASITAATIDRREGDLIMDWWILELIWFAAMVATALWLGPFIRRFGKAYAADVFRANPRTGKSFIVLMDVAYYLIFFAYILFTVRFEPDKGWEQTVNANQLQACTIRFGGILLIVGLLHGLNVLTLPIMGRIFTLNRRLDDDTTVGADR